MIATTSTLRVAQIIELRGLRVQIIAIEGDVVRIQPLGWTLSVPVQRTRLLETLAP